jgi:hypothetical protein
MAPVPGKVGRAMSRQDFTMDCLFGMPGVQGPGACEILAEGTPGERFKVQDTELTYQVWLRGYNSKALRVRDKLMEGKTDVWVVGYAEDAGPHVCAALQKEGFLPKRSGD